MIKSLTACAVLVSAASVVSSPLAGAQDGQGRAAQAAMFGEDFTFPGAELTQDGMREYDEVEFYVSPLNATYEAGEILLVEGKVAEAKYQAPVERSVLEVYRAYTQYIEAQGFEEIFSCRDETGANGCAGNVGYLLGSRARISNAQNRADQRYSVYARTKDGADETVAVFVTKGGPGRVVDVIVQTASTDAEEEQLQILDASAISNALEQSGAASIYGLEFAFGSAELLPESKPVLDQMAAYLTAAPDVNILLVGHTDNRGGLDTNQALSLARAQAVRAALIADYGISGDRLDAHGVGFLAPKASNASDAGQAKNRRVEMVLR